MVDMDKGKSGRKSNNIIRGEMIERGCGSVMKPPKKYRNCSVDDNDLSQQFREKTRRLRL